MLELVELKNSSFFAQFWSSFFQYSRRAKKRYEIFIKSYGKYCKSIESIESMEKRFYVYWHIFILLEIVLRSNNSVQSYNSVDFKKQLIFMSPSRRRNDKTNKIAESKSVLGGKFLFATLSFDLVLTQKQPPDVFCKESCS